VIRILFLTLLLGVGTVRAQDDLVAYVPKRNISRMADSETITLTSTGQHGIYRLTVPSGTVTIDVLDARGEKLLRQPPIENGILNVRALKASTYTIRAHSPSGISIRRFALMGRGASLWAIDAEPVPGPH
jgi:hypothetical protein